MLELILGVAGTGKTTRLLNKMEQRASAGQPGIFLVPEQFSSTAEAMVYHRLGDANSARIEVVSFRTLAERIFKSCGGGSAQTLTDAGRVVFVRRALDSLGAAEGLGAFARQRRSAAFCSLCANTIHELKTAGATPAVLRGIGQNAGEAKFAGIASVFEAYEAAIAGAAVDPEDRLEQAAQKTNCGYFSGKYCYIDNFDGFTAPEYTLLQQLIARCESVCVALCCNALAETDGGIGLFSPVRKTAGRLLDMARQAGVAALAPEVLPTLRRTEVPALAAVNNLLANEADPAPGIDTAGLTLTNPADEWEEVALVAAEMRRLAQTGVPYSCMAVVCRDLSAYESAVRRQFGLFEIPYFTDAAATVEYTAPVAFLRAALSLLHGGLGSAALLALLKTGLCGFAEAEIAALENYVYTWGPKAADWRAPFENNPDGLLAELSAEGKKQLAAAESLRATVISKVETFLRQGKNASAKALSKQLYLLLDRFDAATHMEELAAGFERRARPEQAAALRRSWDLAMGMLDQMALLLGEETLSAAEYDELLLLLVRATDVGQLPQSLECAVFTEAGRMRLADPDYCFVLGLAEGEFPMQVGYSGLLTHADRDLLVAGGVEMPGSFENRVLLEQMFFYRALTAPHKGLYLSWPKRRAGVAKSVSAALQPVQAQLAPPPLAPALARRAATPGAAFELLGRLYRENTPQAAALYHALAQSGRRHSAALLEMLQTVQNPGTFRVHDKTVLRQLVGDGITLSATRAERYYECRFSYYLERVLGVRPRKRGQLSPLESGTFVHHILEQVLRDTGAAFPQCTDEQLAALAATHADAFIEQFLPAQTRRAAYLLEQIKESVAALLCRMRDAAAQSEFVIDAVELPISDEPGGIPPIAVTTPDGRVVRVTGKVDRVDTLQQNGKTYVCIVDYKTGGKKFSLDDVYFGLNMQMMIYMQAICQNGNERYPNAVPAGVLYLTGDPAPATGGRQQQLPTYEMDGLLLDDPAVLQGLDREGRGVFLPVKHEKGTSRRAGGKLADLARMGAVGNRVQTLLAEMAAGLYEGNFDATPLVKANWRPCDYCPYRAACRHEDGRNETPVQPPPDAFDAEGEVAQ